MLAFRKQTFAKLKLHNILRDQEVIELKLFNIEFVNVLFEKLENDLVLILWHFSCWLVTI